MDNNYKVLSFDVGIKNLAFCIINFDKETKDFQSIENWGLINLKSDLWVPDHNEKKCQAMDKKKNICNKASNCWVLENGKRIEMCRMHSKPYEKNFYETIRENCNLINQNPEKLGFEFFPYDLRDLRCKCGEKSRKFLTKITKSEDGISKLSLDNIKIAGFCNKCAKIYEKDNEKLTKVVDYLKEDDTKLYTKLYEGLSNLGIENLNEVVIENQPALKNPRMKSIQMFIYSFFFINGKNGLIKKLEGVNFFSATKKLNPTAIVEGLLKSKNPDTTPGIKSNGDKKQFQKNKKDKKQNPDLSEVVESVEESMTESAVDDSTDLPEVNLSEYQAYKKRKNDSVAIVTEILKEMDDWKKYFISHPKKDDLADSLLQGIAQWCMHSSKN